MGCGGEANLYLDMVLALVPRILENTFTGILFCECKGGAGCTYEWGLILFNHVC